jgi:hypothetical protein
MATAKHLTPHFQAERWPRRKSLGPLGSARLTSPFTHQQHSLTAVRARDGGDPQSMASWQRNLKLQ